MALDFSFDIFKSRSPIKPPSEIRNVKILCSNFNTASLFYDSKLLSVEDESKLRAEVEVFTAHMSSRDFNMSSDLADLNLKDSIELLRSYTSYMDPHLRSSDLDSCKKLSKKFWECFPSATMRQIS